MKSLTAYLRASEWMQDLEPALASQVEARALDRRVDAGTFVYSRGMQSEFWVGVVDGLLLMSRHSESGQTTAIAPVHAGEWIGEASLIFLSERQFDLVAVRPSRLACIPRSTFRELYEQSIPFNHYLIRKLSKRVGQLARLVSSGRLLTPVGRTALCLSAFLDAQGPSRDNRLAVTQLEAGRLTGLSRQHVNKALHELKEMKVVSVERGGVKVLDPEALRRLIS